MADKTRILANLISDNNLSVNTTTDYVGIGTTNPSDKLDVNGNVRIRSGLKDFYGNVGVAGSILVSTGAGVSWVNPTSSTVQGIQGTQATQGLQGLSNQGVQGIQGVPGPIGSSFTITNLINLLYSSETESSGSSDTSSIKSYSVAANSYNYILVESEVGIDATTVDAEWSFTLVYAGVTKETIPLRIANTGTGDQFKLRATIKYSEAFTSGGTVQLNVAAVGTAAGTWQVHSFRVYGVDDYLFGAGAQGAQGVQGLQGLQGTQGVQGLSNQGVQGLQGLQGIQGLQGNQGVQGLQGLQGTQGLQGNQGVQGLQGLQGVQGLQGNQGTQGVTGPVAGSANQIVYKNASNTATGNANFLFLDDSTVIVGAATSQGTANQKLQVTGGAYVSGSVGIGSTLPTTALDVNGVLSFSRNNNVRIGNTNTGGLLLGGGGIRNVSVGPFAGGSNSSGNDNVFIGQGAGYWNTTGSRNVYIGPLTSFSTGATTSEKVIIGSGYPTALASGSYFDAPSPLKDTQLAIGGVNAAFQTRYWIVGDENFNIGIGTTNPSDKLDVGGNVRIRSGLKDFYGNVGAAGSVLTVVGAGIGVSWTTPFAAGLQGNQGIQGLQGDQGLQGLQGTQGLQGNQGIQGLQGLQGTQGLQGNQGVQGLQGLQGTQGLQGNQGVQGLQGNQGVQGLQGNQGVQGLQGNQGTQGLQGNQGVQGLQGNQGAQGLQGNQGVQGFSNQGLQGIQGISGGGGGSGSLSVNNDTTSTSPIYVALSTATTGPIGFLTVSSTKFTFIPSTGTLTGVAATFTANPSATLSALNLSGSPSASNINRGIISVGTTVGFDDQGILGNFVADTEGYAQVIVQNKNASTSSSADVIVNNDRLLGALNYGDFGINSSGFTAAGPFTDPSGTYLYAAGGTVTIGTLDNFNIRFAANNTIAYYIDTNAVSYFGTSASSIVLTNPLAVFTDNVAGYSQIQIQNLSSAVTASVDYIASTDTATDTAEYIDLGINGSGYTTAGLWAAKDGYLYVQAPTTGNGGNLVLGTSGLAGRDIIFHTAGTAVTNERMRIKDAEVLIQDNVEVVSGSIYGKNLAAAYGMFIP
jgi:hypothetical protein